MKTAAWLMKEFFAALWDLGGFEYHRQDIVRCGRDFYLVNVKKNGNYSLKTAQKIRITLTRATEAEQARIQKEHKNSYINTW